MATGTLQVRDANGNIQYVQTGSGAGTSGSPYTGSVGYEGDGTNQFLSGSAANLAAISSINAQIVTPPGQWSVTNAPTVATQATGSQAAAGTSIRNVCNWISCTLANDATGSAQANLLFNLRNGGTGAGTIIASFTLSVPATAGACQVLTLSGLNIPGSANTAMTLETASSTATHTAASIAFGGTTCV